MVKFGGEGGRSRGPRGSRGHPGDPMGHRVGLMSLFMIHKAYIYACITDPDF